MTKVPPIAERARAEVPPTAGRASYIHNDNQTRHETQGCHNQAPGMPHTNRVKQKHSKPCKFIPKTSLLEEAGNLTSPAMMNSMACITMMMQWVMDMNHTHVFGWNDGPLTQRLKKNIGHDPHI